MRGLPSSSKIIRWSGQDFPAGFTAPQTDQGNTSSRRSNQEIYYVSVTANPGTPCIYSTSGGWRGKLPPRSIGRWTLPIQPRFTTARRQRRRHARSGPWGGPRDPDVSTSIGSWLHLLIVLRTKGQRGLRCRSFRTCFDFAAVRSKRRRNQVAPGCMRWLGSRGNLFGDFPHGEFPDYCRAANQSDERWPGVGDFRPVNRGHVGR